ncbi:unnamed protein product [Brachionus calyciflorus]|uniref:C2H2-type domain-containing protein n=1 Tax=Brachionus calyciflorus TaxID=104777 RepID=A0A814BLW6_9BILA|nr:unnamed protein product [Brachionus calyciflorus]
MANKLIQNERFSFLDPEKLASHYDSIEFTKIEKNHDGSIIYRCCKCSLTFNVQNDMVLREPKGEHKSIDCIVILPVQIGCIKAYEN